MSTAGNVKNFDRTLMPSEGSLKKDIKTRDKSLAKLIMVKANEGFDDEVIWLSMHIITPQIVEVVCSWLRSQNKHVLESQIREKYPYFNAGHSLDRNKNQVLVIKEKIVGPSTTNQVTSFPFLTCLTQSRLQATALQTNPNTNNLSQRSRASKLSLE
jgi:hypothetical protein